MIILHVEVILFFVNQIFLLSNQMLNHGEISRELNVDFYFAKPYHSQERAANENFNGHLRNYFPQVYNFDLVTKEGILRIVEKFKNRPRKRFGYMSLNQVFFTNY